MTVPYSEGALTTCDTTHNKGRKASLFPFYKQGVFLCLPATAGCNCNNTLCLSNLWETTIGKKDGDDDGTARAM